MLCQFALLGLSSQPATSIDIQDAKLIGRHASIVGGFGAFGERTWGPHSLLVVRPYDLGADYGRPGNHWSAVNFYWVNHDPGVLDKLGDLTSARQLQAISTTLPALVAAAFHASRHNVAETIIVSWIVTEELLSALWDVYVAGLDEPQRRKRLKDSRTYTASVRLEQLHTARVIGADLYDVAHAARKVRNALAHRGEMSDDAASACSLAMHAMLRQHGVDPTWLPQYSVQMGGAGEPRQALEPEFPFRKYVPSE